MFASFRAFVADLRRRRLVRAEFSGRASDATNSSSIATANRLRDYGDNYTAFMNRTKVIYSKGAYVLSRLHKEIGDDAFLTFLRSREPTAARPYRQTCEEAR